MFNRYWNELTSLNFFFRKKTIDDSSSSTGDGETKLARVLNTLDLTALGLDLI
jgi:hypothetical protein